MLVGSASRCTLPLVPPMIVPTLTDSGSRVWMGGPLRSSSCQSTGHHPMGRSASATLLSNPLLHPTLQVSVVLLQEPSAKLTTERMRVQVTILQRRISLIRRCFQLSHQGERSTFNVQRSIISGSLGANERGYSVLCPFGLLWSFGLN